MELAVLLLSFVNLHAFSAEQEQRFALPGDELLRDLEALDFFAHGGWPRSIRGDRISAARQVIEYTGPSSP
jgi:hypothetical protein